MIDLMKLKNSQKVLALLVMGLSFLLPAFSTSIYFINSFKLDLGFVIGFQDPVSNFILFVISISLLSWGIFELLVLLIVNYFESERLFIYNQRNEIKFLLRISIALRNLLVGILYFTAFIFPVLFNWFFVFDIIISIAVGVFFFFVARNNFGKDLIALHLFKTISKVYLLFIAFSLVLRIGGILI